MHLTSSQHLHRTTQDLSNESFSVPKILSRRPDSARLADLCPDPQDLTWTGQALRLDTGVDPLNTWFPQLTFDLYVLAKASWEDTEQTPENFYPVCKYSE